MQITTSAPRAASAAVAATRPRRRQRFGLGRRAVPRGDRKAGFGKPARHMAAHDAGTDETDRGRDSAGHRTPPPARHSGAVSGGEAHLGLVDAEPLHRGLKTQEMRGL